VEVVLAPPRIGYRKDLVVRTIGSTSSFFYIDASSSGTTILGTTAGRITMNTTGDAVSLVGYSSSLWLVLGGIDAASTMVVLSTST
jgi:hypothetical protein